MAMEDPGEAGPIVGWYPGGGDRRDGDRAWAPSDDLCPPWWPRRSRRALARVSLADLPVDQRAAERIYTGLTMIASTFELSDEGLARAVRILALAHLRDAAVVVARGASRPWVASAPVCPPAPSTAGDAATPRSPVPGRGGELLDALGLLQTYGLAATVFDASARQTATRAIGCVLLEQVGIVASSFG